MSWISDNYGRLRVLITDTLWHSDLRPHSKWKRYLLGLLRVVFLSARRSRKVDLFTKAFALTFVSLLAIVPLLAFSFSVAKGLGLAQRLKEILIKNFAMGQTKALTYIFEYVERTNVSTLGIFGVLIFFYAALKMLDYIERNMNDIWGVTRQRPLLRKFSDYTSVLLVCPVLLIVSTSAMASLESASFIKYLLSLEGLGAFLRFVLNLAPWITIWLALTFFYVFMPNTRVRLSAAVVGALCAGSILLGLETIYIKLQIGVSRYNAIYGTFATLPLFMIWLQLSWTVVLFGAELTYAAQNMKRHLFEPDQAPLTAPARRRLAVRLMVILCRDFLIGRSPSSMERLLDSVGAARLQTRHVISDLVSAGLVTETSDDNPGYQPSRPPAGITLADVIDAVEGEDDPALAGDFTRGDLADLLELSDGALNDAALVTRSRLESVTLAGLSSDKTTQAADSFFVDSKVGGS